MAPPAAELAIAKASLSAVLFRPEPSSCSRDEIEQFHGLLGETISRCSPTNVQKCKQWALQHLVRSPTRAGALGRYLVALANTYTPEASAKSPRPSAKRRRLHVLYILSDIFHHVKQRLADDTFITGIEPHLPALFRSAASFSKCPKHIRKIEKLVDIWEDKGYVSPQLIEELRQAVEEGPALAAGAGQNGASSTEISTSSNKAKDAPFVMPSMHGDATTPWFDLPAANWLPVIEPNSTRPMNPAMIRPLQLASGPPDKALVDAVKKLLVDVDKIYASDVRLDGDILVDVAQTGEIIERDEINGDIMSGDTYYGWSRAFCQKMRARRNKGGSDEPRGRMSSRSRSRSLSRDRSSSGGSPHPAFKRRRLSSTSRSRSPDGRRDNYRDVSASRSRSRSRRRSYSRPGFQRGSRSYSRSRSPPPRRNFGRDFDGGIPSRSPHYSPPPSMPPSYGNNGHFNQPPHHPPPPPPPNMPPIPPPQAGYGAWNAPPPPPPPPGPGYQGQWPPPPPPGGPQQNWVPPNPNQWPGAWPVPPPPPPPQAPQYQGGYQYGRGGGGGYRGGRGGYNNRGRGW